MRYAYLAVEDAVGEALGKRLLLEAGFEPLPTQGLKGDGWLKKNARKLNQASKQLPVLMLTDLDRPDRCVVDLIDQWVPPDEREPTMLIRAAVLEGEAWIMADLEAFAKLVGVTPGKLAVDPDSVLDPKEALVRVARDGKDRAVRDDLVPAKNSTASVGPGYNLRLTGFVGKDWDPERAAARSPSLARARRALVKLRELVDATQENE